MDEKARSGGRWAVVAALMALGVAATARPGRGQAPTLEDYEGRYVFVGGEREEQRMRAAVDAVVDRMNLFIREIARGRVHEHVHVQRRLEVDRAGERTVRVTFGAWGPHRVPLDGREVEVRGPDGGRTRLSARFDGGRLLVRQRSSRGWRQNRLELAPDGERLTLRVRLGADPLPDDIRYALTYRRR